MTDEKKNFEDNDNESAKGKPPTDPTDKLTPDSRKGSDGMKPQVQRNDNNKNDTSI